MIRSTIVTLLLFFAISNHSFGQSIDTVDDICRHFQGRVLGQMNGAPYRATCTEIRLWYANAHNHIPRPFFTEFRQIVRRERANNFRSVIADDPTLRRVCREGRSRNQVTCELPLGAPNTVLFSLNDQNLIDKATILVSNTLLEPVIKNQSARNNISNPTADFILLIMNISVVHARAISQADELYSVNGGNIVYELWPWRLR